jgi:hypothetical protein
MDVLETRPLIFDPQETAGAGGFVTLDREGKRGRHRGYVRPEDLKCGETDGQRVRGYRTSSTPKVSISTKSSKLAANAVKTARLRRSALF